MAETGGASMAGIAGNNNSGNGNKRIIKSGEDRISSLPDYLIHHILSFLPATDLVKTMVLSKWWNYQWTRVPVLNFIPNDDDEFPDLDLWIRFAVRKDVKELILLKMMDQVYYSPLPKFVFNNSSLVKLKLSGFFVPQLERVNWGCVKSLRLYKCGVFDGVLENVLSGSPLLEHLELRHCGMLQYRRKLVIASKSLKTLILAGVDHQFCGIGDIEISCPNLERLRVSGHVGFRSFKLMNLPSSVHATLDFFLEYFGEDDYMSHDACINFVQQTLRQVEHVEKLELGRSLMEWRDLIWKDQQKNALSNEVR